MAISILQAPEIFGLSGNPCLWRFQSDNYLQAVGVKALHVVAGGYLFTENQKLIFAFGNEYTEMIAITGATTNGVNLPAGGVDAATLIPYLQANYTLSKNFNITQNASDVFFTAKEKGTAYNLKPYTWFSTNTVGVNATEKTNFKFIIDVFFKAQAEADFKEIYSEEIAQDSFLSGKCSFDASRVLNAALKHDLPDFNSALPEAAQYSKGQYYIRIAEMYGSPATPKNLFVTQIKHIAKGGLSTIGFKSATVKTLLSPDDADRSKDAFLKQGLKSIRTRTNQSENLAFVNFRADNTTLKAKITINFTDGTTSTFNTASINVAAYDKVFFKIGYDVLALALVDNTKIIKDYKVELLNQADALASVAYKYHLDFTWREKVRYFVYLNSLGGFDTLATYAKGDQQFDRTLQQAESFLKPDYNLSDGDSAEFDISLQTKFKVVTNFLDARRFDLLNELYLAELVFLQRTAKIIPVRITNSKTGAYKDGVNQRSQPLEYEFKFKDHYYTEGDLEEPGAYIDGFFFSAPGSGGVSATETDPTVGLHIKAITPQDIVRWNSFSSAPVDSYTQQQINDFFAGGISITGYNKNNWDNAYSWGNHASVGYLVGAANDFIKNQTTLQSGAQLNVSKGVFNDDLKIPHDLGTNRKVSLKFKTTAGTGGSPPPGGAQYLYSLLDVGIASPLNGQALLYNSTLGKWQNQNVVTDLSNYWNKTEADGRFKAIGYSPSNTEVISALGFTPAQDIHVLHKIGDETKNGTLTLITPNIASGTSSLNAKTPLSVTGGNGGNNTNTTGTVVSGNAGHIIIKSGNGGSSNSDGVAIAGSGGDAILRAGDGGFILGSGLKFGGNGGDAILQGGTAYGGQPGNAEVKAGNNEIANGIGASIYLTTGWGNQSSNSNPLYDGSIFLGLSASGVVRGNTVIGSATDDRIHKLQVTGDVNITGVYKINGINQLALKANLTDIPTNNNQLTNGAGYIKSAALSPYQLISGLGTAAFQPVTDFQEKENQRLSSGNNVAFNIIEAASKLQIPHDLGTNRKVSLKFKTSAGTGGSPPPGGAQYLYSLLDVGIASPLNGQALLYNSTLGKWQNQNVVTDLSGYYTKTEIGSILGGSTALTGYNKSNWDNAYSWGNHASAGYALANGINASGTWSINISGFSNYSYLSDLAYGLSDVNTGDSILSDNLLLQSTAGPVSITGNAGTATTAGSVPWSGIYSKPTTISGFGITDAPTKTGSGASGTWGINITGNANISNWLFSPVRSGENLDSITEQGQALFSNVVNCTNAPSASWFNIISQRHSNNDNNYVFQIAGDFFNDDVWVRNTKSEINTGWNKLFHSGNISTIQSSLGLGSAAYLTANTGTIYSGAPISITGWDGNILQKYNSTAISDFLGLGSAAYQSTTAFTAANSETLQTVTSRGAGFSGIITGARLQTTNWYTSAFQSESSSNPGYAFHIPGTYAANLYLDGSGGLNWSGSVINANAFRGTHQTTAQVAAYLTQSGNNDYMLSGGGTFRIVNSNNTRALLSVSNSGGLTIDDFVTATNFNGYRALFRQIGISLGTSNSSQLEINNAGSGEANITFHREGAYGANFGLDTNNWFSTYGWSAGAGYTPMRVGAFVANGNATVTGTLTASEVKATSKLYLPHNLGTNRNVSLKFLG